MKEIPLLRVCVCISNVIQTCLPWSRSRDGSLLGFPVVKTAKQRLISLLMPVWERKVLGRDLLAVSKGSTHLEAKRRRRNSLKIKQIVSYIERFYDFSIVIQLPQKDIK